MKTKTYVLLVLVIMTSLAGAYAQRPFFNKSKDLLIAQFDSKPDPDDIHAQAALGSMLTHNDFKDVNYYGVAGAYGKQGGQFIDSGQLFNMVFGTDNWTDAHSNRAASVVRIANKVIPILNNGGKVWVQEAGQSNITRDWLVEVNKSVSNSIVKNNVIVVQHSDWNQNLADNTTNKPVTNPTILNYVKNNSRYFYIDDGNAPFGGFGDHGPWETPEYRSRDKKWLTLALNSPNSNSKKIWNEATRVVRKRYPTGVPYDWSFMKNGGLDYSDCVENWWIFNIGNKADNVEKFWSRYVTNTIDPKPTPCTDKTFEEKNGVAAIEAEDFIKQSKTKDREWFIIGSGGNGSTPKPDPDSGHQVTASGGKYVELLPDTRVTHGDPLATGVSFSDTPGVAAVLDYKVKFNSPGKYFVWVRAYSTGSEDNGVHVGIDGTWPESGKKMQWCTGKNSWTWESKKRTNANHCGVAEQIFINVPTAGVHIVSFSMREDGFEMDKFILSKVYAKPVGIGANVVVSNCKTPETNSIVIPGTIQVENFDSKNGDVKAEDTPGGNKNLGFIKNNNYTEYNINVAKAGSYKLDAFVSSNGVGGSIVASVAENNLTTIVVPVNKEWHNYSVPVSGNLNLAKGTQKIRFTYTGALGFLFNFDRAVLTLNTPSVSGCSVVPTNLAISASTKNSVTISYDNTTNDTRVFELRAFAAGTFNGDINATNLGFATGVSGSTSITMNNLKAGTTYDFVLRALCGVGNTVSSSPVVKISGTTLENTVITEEKTVTLSPIDDAFLSEVTPYNSSILRVEKGRRVSYLKFDISNFKGVFTNATLKLMVAGDKGNGNIEVNLGETNNWTEGNLSTINAPTKGALLGSLNKTYALNEVQNFRLSNLSVIGDFLTLIITQTDGDDVSFASDESLKGKPVLMVNYNTITTESVNNIISKVVVYPNPTVKGVTVSVDDSTIGSRVTVNNMKGILIRSLMISNKETYLDLPTKGMYIIKVIKKGKTLINTKIIKQ